MCTCRIRLSRRGWMDWLRSLQVFPTRRMTTRLMPLTQGLNSDADLGARRVVPALATASGRTEGWREGRSGSVRRGRLTREQISERWQKESVAADWTCRRRGCCARLCRWPDRCGAPGAARLWVRLGNRGGASADLRRWLRDAAAHVAAPRG